MVNIVEAATTISPPLGSRSLIIAMVIIGNMLVFLFLNWMKRVICVLTPLYLIVLYHLLLQFPADQISLLETVS